jgi:hypothetical protein
MKSKFWQDAANIPVRKFQRLGAPEGRRTRAVLGEWPKRISKVHELDGERSLV